MYLADQEPRIWKERKCGAEALTSAYLRLGRQEDVNLVWSRVATEDRRGNWAVASHQLAADAIYSGYEALTLRASRPAELLDQIRELQDIQWIVCHRLRKGSSAGHFSLLTSVDRDVVQTDAKSASQDREREIIEYAKRDFLELWTRQKRGDEFRAGVVIGISQLDSATAGQPARHPSGIPAATNCLRCGATFPVGLLRRIFASENSVGARGWAAVYCPYCDAAHR